MADRSQIAAVYAAGTVQGVVLVTFPAASTIFTSPNYYGLSSTAYGAMFLPQAVTAFYQMGYGIAAFGVGPLERFTGLDLRQIYGLVAVVALAMAALSFVVVTRRSSQEPAAEGIRP
jgi:hypothetical protein